MVARAGKLAGVAALALFSLQGCDSGSDKQKTPLCPAQPQLPTLGLAPGRRAGPTRAAQAFGGWSRLARADPASSRELVFVVKQRNLARLHELLLERSDPRSASYGQWLSMPELREMTQSSQSAQAVEEALRQAGAEILNRTRGGEMIRARASLASWESLLSTTFHSYVSTGQNSSHVAADEYSIPESMRAHLDGIIGVTELPTRQKFSVSAAQSPGKIDPTILRKAYGLPEVAQEGSPEAENRKNVTQAVYASLQQYWSPSDRQRFQQMYSLPDNPVKELDDGEHSSDLQCVIDSNNCAEANLDVEYMLAMSPWSQMGLWYNDDSTGTFVPFLMELYDADEPPEVLSISYGLAEYALTESSVQAFDALALKLSLVGVTLIAASGDDGAAGSSRMWRDGNEECADTDAFGLPVNWPASSQYVTAVGATQGLEAGREESACQVQCGEVKNRMCELHQGGPLITSGGGISAFTAKPAWQEGNPCERRGIPDVSLAGHSYNIVVGGEQAAVDGTSASAPVFGGLISLVNARRKAAGKPTVGFVNPAMYQNPDAFNDITTGDNYCAGSGSVFQQGSSYMIPCCGGYDARTGWDAATGLGSVNFPKFEAIFDASNVTVV